MFSAAEAAEESKKYEVPIYTIAYGTPTGTVQGANDPAHPFPTPKKLVTIAELGGWDKVTSTFFDDKSGIVTQVQQATGKSQ